MKHSINSLIGYNMAGINSGFGEVEAFYFEDATWTIRYLILKTGNRLSRRKVLISPDALVSNYWKPGIFPLLTKDKMHNCSGMNADASISFGQEPELNCHRATINYQEQGIYATGVWSIIESSAVMDRKPINEESGNPGETDNSLHLHSTNTIIDYQVNGTDGRIGIVKDFIMDDQSWQLVYLVVDTNDTIKNKKLLIEVRHIKNVGWNDLTVSVDVSYDSIKNVPTFLEIVHSDYDSQLIPIK